MTQCTCTCHEKGKNWCASCFDPHFDRFAKKDPEETLRDKFAGKAMQSLLLLPHMYDVTNERLAQEAYKMADALIQARDNKN